MLIMKIIAIPAFWAAKFWFSPGGNDASKAVKTLNKATNDPAPNNRGFLRPIQSRIKMMKLVVFVSASDEKSGRGYTQEVCNSADCSIYPLNKKRLA